MRKLYRSERTLLDNVVFEFLLAERVELEAERPTHKFDGRSQYSIDVDPTVRAALDQVIRNVTYTARPELQYELRERLLTNTMARLVSRGVVVKQGRRSKRYMTYGSFIRNENIEREYQQQARQARADTYWSKRSITDTRASLIDQIQGADPTQLMCISRSIDSLS